VGRINFLAESVKAMFRLSAQRKLPVIDSGSLFDAGPIPGLTYRPDYISPAEEAALIACIDRQPWSMELLRRRQWYGWSYDDSPLGLDGDYRSLPMPDWLTPFAQRLAMDRHLDGVADRALINEYFPGQGIGAHKDRDIERIKAVAIISLGSGIMMDFTRLGHATRCEYLQPRSLVIMRAEVREAWTHGIVGRLNDKVGGVVIPRGRRMSLTFRYVAPEVSPFRHGAGAATPSP
jgi:alkylated DNA repair dioxygenase AlkB